MNLTKDAKKDAAAYARAEMFYGEGAGTRRRLIGTTIQYKAAHIPGYAEAFDKAYANQNMIEHAEAAAKERKHRDTKKKIDRNARGLVTGNRHNMTTTVAAGTAIWYVLSQTGLDEDIKHHAAVQYQKGKGWVQRKHAQYKAKKEASSRGNHGL